MLKQLRASWRLILPAFYLFLPVRMPTAGLQMTIYAMVCYVYEVLSEQKHTLGQLERSPKAI